MGRLNMSASSGALSFGQRSGVGGDRWYVCMPMYHGTGGITSVANLLSGLSIAIGKKFSVSRFWPDVIDSESTFFIYVGETARYLLAAPPSPLDKAHKIRCMYGNGLRPDVWRRFQERFNVPEVAEFFNSTEGLFGLQNWCRGDFTTNAVGHHGLILRTTMKNSYVPVLTDHLTGDIVRDPSTGLAIRMPYHVGGEMLAKIPNEQAFSGYWNAPAATQKKFARDVMKKGDLYWRSGDALRRDDEGRWYFLDRLGDTYRWKSENVSTAEVAEALGHFPGILEANVYGVLVPGHDGRAGCAAVAIAPELKDKFDWKGLLAYTNQKLPRYAVPVFIRIVEGEVGGTASHNNKQNKVPLRDEGIDPALKGSKVASGANDKMLWVPPKGDSYVSYEEKDWQSLVAGQARL